MSDQWTEVELGSIATLSFGATPSRNVSHYWATGDEGYPWASISDLRSSPVVGTKERITVAGVRGSSVSLVRPGTPMMSFKLTIGRVAIAGRELYTNEAIVAVNGRDGVVSNSYLAHVLPEVASDAVVDIAVKGATLNKEKLQRLLIRLPPLAEQRLIAEILDTLDESISQTRRVIAKMSGVADGIVRNLLDNSHGMARVGDHLAAIEAGISPDLPEVPATVEQWGVLKVSSIRALEFFPQENKRLFNSALINPALEVRHGDLLISRANTPNLVGLACYVDSPRANLMLSDKTLRLVAERRSLDAQFAAIALSMPDVRRQIEISGTGSSGSMKNISQSDIRSLLIQLPDLQEQRRIVDAFRRSRESISRLAGQSDKLLKVKRGFMVDLLTGRARMK